jgi:hypothetical protein
MASQPMRYIERKWGANGDGMSSSREALLYEAALCSSTMETAQYFERAAARSAMSVSDSAENVPADEDWKEQYESRDVHPKCFLCRCRFFHNQNWAKFQQTVKNVVEQQGIVVIQVTGHQCLTF